MIKKIYKNIVSEKDRNNLLNFIRRKKAFWYSGDQYYCNCCKKSFRKFLPKGNIKRKNAMCPYCFSLERTRLLLAYLQNETEIFNKHLKVLHVAPEKCLFDILKEHNLEYVDGDINPAYANNILDVRNIQFSDNYFDLIICSHVLGHVPEEEQAISELSRVLKTDGVALFLTLINNELNETFEDEKIITSQERLINYGEPDLCRLHGADFHERLRKSFSKVKQIDYRDKIPNSKAIKLSLGDGKRELIFESKK